MTEQAKTLQKNFFETLMERLQTIGKDAWKQFDMLTEKGQKSQKELVEQLKKNAEEFARQAKDARGKTASFVASNLRQAASRIERIA